jgi:hypothetical protein
MFIRVKPRSWQLQRDVSKITHLLTCITNQTILRLGPFSFVRILNSVNTVKINGSMISNLVTVFVRYDAVSKERETPSHEHTQFPTLRCPALPPGMCVPSGKH